jgi:hypothetical protein
MKQGWLFLLILSTLGIACEEKEIENPELTGNEVVYQLASGSDFGVMGTATIQEVKGGKAKVTIELNGLPASGNHPVHLHWGDVGTPDAEIAALLTPISNTNKSETKLNVLSDESAVTYQSLLSLDASIKVHLAENGPDRDIILVAGNIGAATTNARSKQIIAVCK